ncbi:MAG: o-succinylbenzoate synthase, partial [Acidimicrobiales bacterium]
MQLEQVELRRVSLGLRRPFRSAHGVIAYRDVLLVRVRTDGGEGWGECAAPAQVGYTDEDVDGAHVALRDLLAPRLLAARSPIAAADVEGRLAGITGFPMAKAALEMAVLDAELRSAGRSFAQFLGGTRSSVEAGVALGIAGSMGELLDAVAVARAEGYRRVKLKVEPGWDLGPVAAVRERFGDDLILQVDGNGSYSLSDAGHLAGLDSFGLAMIEQPLPAGDLAGHAALAARLRTPVCLDESVTSAAVAAQAIALSACSVVNVKPGRVGGYFEARRVHDVCQMAGVAVWCGG